MLFKIIFSNFVAVFNIKLLIFQSIGVMLIIFFRNLHHRKMHNFVNLITMLTQKFNINDKKCIF